MMKRITITLDEDMYIRLLDYSVDRSKAEFRNVSTSEAIRELLAMQLRRMGKVHGKSSRDYGPKVGNFDAPQ
ncbi:MAG TPA: CopG family transcriptional regulator [Nitrososphaerales archaeon]|nr:CopG family transcriptional regulator [Nitrososphaerales archaeon]